MTDDLRLLLKRVQAATGRDERLDREIALRLDEVAENLGTHPTYTGSVDCCLELIERVLPGWHWHVGYGPKGIMPYASLVRGDARFEAIAPTVPLALLIALLRARISN